MPATIIICAILALAVSLIIRGLLRDKKNGKTTCSCGCKGCPSSGICHGKKP